MTTEEQNRVKNFAMENAGKQCKIKQNHLLEPNQLGIIVGYYIDGKENYLILVDIKVRINSILKPMIFYNNNWPYIANKYYYFTSCNTSSYPIIQWLENLELVE